MKQTDHYIVPSNGTTRDRILRCLGICWISSRICGCGARSWIVVATTLVLTASPVLIAADDSSDEVVSPEPPRPALVSVAAGDASFDSAPTASATMRSSLTKKLERTYLVAQQRLRQYPSCRALFQGLEHDGFETLEHTIYVQASKQRESQVCGSATVAFTRVNSPVVTLCKRFDRISDAKAAVVMLHEALHTAGLDERPHDPDGMTPYEINFMVERSCGFGVLLARR